MDPRIIGASGNVGPICGALADFRVTLRDAFFHYCYSHPVGSPQPRDKRKTHRLLLLHEGSFWLWWWSQESAHVIKSHKMKHVHMHNMNTHTSTCKPVETWVRSVECIHDCDVVLQLCETITLVKSIQNLSLLFLMTVNPQLSQKRTSLPKKRKKKCQCSGDGLIWPVAADSSTFIRPHMRSRFSGPRTHSPV